MIKTMRCTDWDEVSRLAVTRAQFAVLYRNGAWEVSYVETAPEQAAPEQAAA